MRNPLARGDALVSEWAEDVARKISRREALSRATRRGAAVAAGLSLGSLVGMRSATAAVCSCAYPGCGHCSCRGKSCPSNGCPSGCYICTSTQWCGGQCPYDDANWICCSNCCGQGFGYYKCWDCRCTTCSATCGCRSTCLCSGCFSTADVKAEMAREEGRVGAPV